MIALIVVNDTGEHVGLIPLGDSPGRTIRTIADKLANCVPFVTVERTYAHAGGKMGSSAAHSLGKSEGQILGALDALNIPYESVRPQEWKASVLAGTDKSKDAAVAFVRRRYPRAKIFLPKGKPNFDAAEAVCMAEFARRK